MSLISNDTLSDFISCDFGICEINTIRPTGYHHSPEGVITPQEKVTQLTGKATTTHCDTLCSLELNDVTQQNSNSFVINGDGYLSRNSKAEKSHLSCG